MILGCRTDSSVQWHASCYLYIVDLALNAGGFARAVAALGTAEEHTALSRALSQLSEVEEKVEAVHLAQSEADFYILAELIHDYVGMVQAVKVTGLNSFI